MTLPDVAIGISLLLISVAILAAGVRPAFKLTLVSVGCVGLWLLLWIGALEGVLYAASLSEPVAGVVTALTSTPPGQLLFSSLTGLLALAVLCALALRFRFGGREGGHLVAALVCSIGAVIALQPVLLPGVAGSASLWMLYGGSVVFAFVLAPLGARRGTWLGSKGVD